MTSERGVTKTRDLRLLLVAAVLAVVVIVAVFTVGIDRPPQLPALSDEQVNAPQAPIAWSSWTENRMCLYIAETTGEVRTVTCDIEGELAGFDVNGPLTVLAWSGRPAPSQTVTTVDRDTGAVLDTRRTDQEFVYDGQREPTWFRDGNELVVRYENRDVWRIATRSSYTIFSGRVSPDGRQIILTDSVGRIIVLNATGDPTARVWVDYSQSRNRFWPNTVLWEGDSLLGGG